MTESFAGPPEPAAPGVAEHARSHTVHLYDDDSVLLDEASRFVGAALGGGDTAIVIATPAHRDAIFARLAVIGIDLDVARAQGRLIARDAADTLAQLTTDDRIDEDKVSRVIGGIIRDAGTAEPSRRVAIFGEMVALLAADGAYESAIELERCWNILGRELSFTLRCGYPMGVFNHAEHGDILDRICAEHTSVVPVETYSALTSDDDRLRTIALLQQKAQLLEHEVIARAQSDQALLERNRELQVAIAARDEFLYVAAHELRTPVTGLRGYTQLLLRDVSQGRTVTHERLAKSLAMFERQIYQLNQLIGRMLNTSQIKSGKLRIVPAPTDLVALVASVLAQQPPHERHHVVLVAPTHLEATLDPVRFEQVITNLLDNAMKYSPLGGTVTIALRDDDPAGITLSVTDAGIGIPDDQREAVFEKFHQANRESQLSGIGLGLYICREIVELHGGSVRIEQPEHAGTRVVVTLPRPAA